MKLHLTNGKINVKHSFMDEVTMEFSEATFEFTLAELTLFSPDLGITNREPINPFVEAEPLNQEKKRQKAVKTVTKEKPTFRANASETETQIIEFLTKNGKSDSKAMFDHVVKRGYGQNYQVFSNRLWLMKKKELISNPEHGIYSIAKEAKEAPKAKPELQPKPVKRK